MKAKKREERCPTCNSPRKSVRRIVRHDYGTVPTLESRCTDPWHSPAPVDAAIRHTLDRYEEALRKLANTDPFDQVDPGKSGADGVPRKPEAPPASEPEPFVESFNKQMSGGNINQPPRPNEATAPAEGAEQFWDRKYGSPDSLTKGSVKAVACEFAEAYAAALREQLAQVQFEVEALKGNVKDWRKAYEDVQRELEETFKVVQGYQVQHNVICSVESHNKITECPCENCIAARALARSTEEAKK